MFLWSFATGSASSKVVSCFTRRDLAFSEPWLTGSGQDAGRQIGRKHGTDWSQTRASLVTWPQEGWLDYWQIEGALADASGGCQFKDPDAVWSVAMCLQHLSTIAPAAWAAVQECPLRGCTFVNPRWANQYIYYVTQPDWSNMIQHDPTWSNIKSSDLQLTYPQVHQVHQP